MSLIWKAVGFTSFFVGIARYVAFFLPFYFWLPLQDMLHLNFLAPLIFCNPCKICCIFRFWSLIAPCSIKITLFNKLIFHSTSCILWRNLLLNSVFFMAKSLIKLRALHGEKSVLRIMSIKALSLICLTLQLSGSLYPLPKTDPLSVLATQHLCMKSSQASS